jgi:hypothetical protein
MHRQGRDLGDVAHLGSNAKQVEDGLEREIEGAVANQGPSAEHLAVVLGQHGGVLQSGLDRDLPSYPNHLSRNFTKRFSVEVRNYITHCLFT